MAALAYGVLLAVVALAALAVLALMLLSLWRKTRSLMREVAKAGETVEASTAALEQAQRSAGDRPGSPARPPTVTRPTPARHR